MPEEEAAFSPDGRTLATADAAGNQSAASNTVTRNGTGGATTNLALGKPITGTPNTFTFVVTNANDGDLTTYFEGSTSPAQATVQLGANADLSSVVVALNPDPIWSTRTQTIAVLGREQSASAFTTLVPAQQYTFNPATNGNKVTIPVTGREADVELSITSNTGAPGGQVAEFQVFGTPSPNPDLTVTTSSFAPTSPVETDPVTLSATVQNIGTAASAASNVNFYLGTTKVGTAAVGALAVGASQTVTANVGPQTAGTYQYTAKVDEAKAKTLLAEVDQTDELVAGNKVWFLYDSGRDTFRTYVTQGEAGRTPLAVRRAMKRKLIAERDQALAQRDEAAAARDEAVRTVNDLQQVKTSLEADIAVLRENKAALEGSVQRLSSDLSFRQNSLFYHAANTRQLRDQGVLSSVLKRVQDVKPVNYDAALDLRETNIITLAPEAFGLDHIGKVRMLPNIFQEGRDFKIETYADSGIARVFILDPELFKGKEVLLAVGG